jgi:hypothetical protein
VHRQAGNDANAAANVIPVLIARFPNQITVADIHYKPIQAYSLPKELRDVDLSWSPLADGRVVVDATPYRKNYFLHQIYWYDASGKIVRQEVVNLNVPVPVEKEIAGFRADVCMFIGSVAPCGVVPGIVSLNLTVGNNALFPIPLWVGLPATGIFSMFWGFICFRRQRKFGLAKTWLWVAFVMLFGGPAYLGYRFHHAWPVRLPCPHCRRSVPRDRPACFACGREFPTPEKKGIEIFA